MPTDTTCNLRTAFQKKKNCNIAIYMCVLTAEMMELHRVKIW